MENNLKARQEEMMCVTWNYSLSDFYFVSDVTKLGEPSPFTDMVQLESQHEMTYLFLNLNGCIIDVWELISNFIPHFVTDMITYPYWD